MSSKKENTIIIELPASAEACNAIISNVVRSVPEEIQKVVATNMILDWQRSGILNQSLTGAARQLCSDAVHARSEDIEHLVDEYLKSADEELRQRCEDIFSEKSAELIASRVQAMCERVIRKVENEFHDKADRLANDSLDEFKRTIQEKLPGAAGRAADFIARETGVGVA